MIGSDGLILTIGYLILEADSIQVTTHDNRVVPARAVGYDQATGFGLVRSVLPLRGIQPVALGNAREVPARSSLLAATGGEDGGMGLTQLVGRRAVLRLLGVLHRERAVHRARRCATTAARRCSTSAANSWASAASSSAMPWATAEQVPGNMFVPVDLLKPILAEMQQTGSTSVSRRPWLGLSSTEQGGRIQIVRVNRDSPAQDAGLAAGDFVLAIDGEKVSTLEGFYKKLWARPEPESEVQLTILHGAQILQVTVRAMDRMKTIRKPEGI